jgi:hypothetical protein
VLTPIHPGRYAWDISAEAGDFCYEVGTKLLAGAEPETGSGKTEEAAI